MRMPPTRPRRLGVGVRRDGRGDSILTLSLAAPVLAHEERTVGGYDLEVGFIAEPVYVGERSGLEIHVTKDDKPVEGLETTLKAQVVFGSQQRDLTLVGPRGRTRAGTSRSSSRRRPASTRST